MLWPAYHIGVVERLIRKLVVIGRDCAGNVINAGYLPASRQQFTYDCVPVEGQHDLVRQPA